MRHWIGLSALCYGFFALVSVLEAFFYAWWDVPEESLLPFMAAGAVVVAPLALFRAVKRGQAPRFQAETKWGEAHPVHAAAIIAAPLLVLSLLPALLGKEAWADGFAWSFGGAGGLFLALLAMAYTERGIRRREARKRAIQPADYKPGKLARGLGLAFFVLLGLCFAVGFSVELTEVLT